MLANQKVVNIFGIVHTAIKLAALPGIVNSDLEPTFAIHKARFARSDYPHSHIRPFCVRCTLRTENWDVLVVQCA
jgi:hypothetical protein